MNSILENETIKNLYLELEKRVAEHILEPNNLIFLKKLLERAESEDEAINICRLGTTFYKTGLRYDVKMETPSDGCKFFVKNNNLSFDNGGIHHKLLVGDNYDSLLNLLVSHKKMVDVIYIDPPYGKDSLGEFAKMNYENSLNRDNLLSMMYARLQAAKQLMSDDGVIFCSIDDKNQAYMKCLFDDVFGGGAIQARHPAQQAGGGGIHVHAHGVDAILHHAAQRLIQPLLGHIVLVLPHANGLGVDLHQLRQRVLHPAGDGHGTAEVYVILRELLRRQLAGGVHGGPGLADHHIADAAP